MSGQDDDQRRRRAGEQPADEARPPAAAERPHAGTRPTELGEVRAHKRVVEEEQTVPVELQREEVHVREERGGERPVRPGEDVFREGTIRVPVRGEEAVVRKEAVVAGEVAIRGGRGAGIARARGGFQRAWARLRQRPAQRVGGRGGATAPGPPRPIEEVEAPRRPLPSPVGDTQVPNGASAAAGAGRPRSRARWALLGVGALTPLVAFALPGVRQALAGTWRVGTRRVADRVTDVRAAGATWAAERERRRLRQTVARLERELARCRSQGGR